VLGDYYLPVANSIHVLGDYYLPVANIPDRVVVVLVVGFQV
jgi:hypothetical protein